VRRRAIRCPQPRDLADASQSRTSQRELRFLDRHDRIAPWPLGITCYLIGGWSGLVVAFHVSKSCCGRLSQERESLSRLPKRCARIVFANWRSLSREGAPLRMAYE
jgi:hypothetical protein